MTVNSVPSGGDDAKGAASGCSATLAVNFTARMEGGQKYKSVFVAALTAGALAISFTARKEEENQE